MKTFVVYLGLSATMALALLSSCAKDDLIEPEYVAGRAPGQTDPVKPKRVWFDKGGNNFGCKEEPGNCLPDYDFIINKNGINRTESFKEIFNAVVSQDLKLISGVFSLHEQFLITFIEPNLVKGVISQSVAVKAKGDLGADYVYLLFYDGTNSEPTSVYPCKLKE